MLPLKLLRSLLLGESISNLPLFLSQNHHQHDNPTNHESHQLDDVDADDDGAEKTTPPKNRNKKTKQNPHHNNINNGERKTPLLIFLPTRELISDTYRLSTIARDTGIDLYPTPSLSHIIFSFPSSSSSSSSSSPTPCFSSSLWSSTSLSLPNDAVPLPFPSLSSAPLPHLRSFVSLSKGLFKLVYANPSYGKIEPFVDSSCVSNWDCCSLSLFSRLTGERIDGMDGFSRAMAGVGWTLFKTKKNSSINGGKMVFLFRKVESRRVWGAQRNGGFRVRELRLPALDFRNAPLRILHYILLMTDDLFYLA